MQSRTNRKELQISAPNTTRWIGIGLLGLPLYGALTFFSSIDPQPDPNTHYEAWSRSVTTDHYVLTHLFGSILGLIPTARVTASSWWPSSTAPSTP